MPPITIRERIGYALGDVASNFFFQTSLVFLTFFYTDIFGLAPAAVGTMFLLVRIWDTVSDPLMGALADRTRTRWGRFRPYVLWGALPFGVAFAFTFTTPDLSAFGRLLYAYVTYTVMLTVYTIVNVPYSAMLGVISPDPTERTRLSTYRFVGAFLAGLAVQFLTLKLAFVFAGGAPALASAAGEFRGLVEREAAPITETAGPAAERFRAAWTDWRKVEDRLVTADSTTANELLTATTTLGTAARDAALPAVAAAGDALVRELKARRASGFQWTMAIFAGLSTVMLVVCAFTTRERVQPLNDDRASLRVDLASLRANRPFLVVCAMSVLLLTYVVMRGGATLYFFKYTLNAEGALPTFLLVGTVVSIVGAMLAPRFTEWFGKRGTLLGVFAVSALGMVLTFFAGPGDWGLLYTLNVVGAFAGGLQAVLQWAIYADTADFGEYHTGHRNTGMIFAGALFALKTGVAVGGAALGWLLAAIAFVPDAVPTEATAFGIRVLYTLAPAALALGCFGLMLWYPLGESEVRRIAGELNQRRSAANGGGGVVGGE